MFALCILESDALGKPHAINIIIPPLAGISRYRKEYVIYEDFMMKKITRVCFNQLMSII